MTRTCDLLVRSQTLYPTELRARKISITQGFSLTAQARPDIIRCMAYKVKGVDPSQYPALAEIEQKTGPSNFLRTMAHRPELMLDFARLYSNLMGSGSIPQRMKEMLYIAVSTVNECSYCAGHHVHTGKASGLSEQEIHEIETEQGQHFSPKEQAALHYARELTRTAAVDDETRYAVQEHFSHDQFVELTMIVGLANFTNRFNNGIGVPLEGDVLSTKV
jgi:uncharacterized peroxidase-related enzyme